MAKKALLGVLSVLAGQLKIQLYVQRVAVYVFTYSKCPTNFFLVDFEVHDSQERDVHIFKKLSERARSATAHLTEDARNRFTSSNRQ